VDEVFRTAIDARSPRPSQPGARLASDEDRDSAQESLRALNAALGAHSLADIGNLNSSFHLALIVPRGQPVTHEILQRLHTLSRRYVRMHHCQRRMRRATREHNELYATWAKGDARGARRFTQRHIEETRDELAAHLSPG
jgi:DNA-binding GntR family transcriptional regulator